MTNIERPSDADPLIFVRQVVAIYEQKFQRQMDAGNVNGAIQTFTGLFTPDDNTRAAMWDVIIRYYCVTHPIIKQMAGARFEKLCTLEEALEMRSLSRSDATMSNRPVPSNIEWWQ